MMDLADSIEAILDGFVEAITLETGEGGSIQEVETVVRGERARPLPKMPAVWVVPQPARFVLETYGEEEAWSMLVSIAALVKSDDPDMGGRKAQQIAARARAAALEFSAEGVAITDVLSETFDPTARSSERNRTLFWCEATVRVTFTVDE